MSVKQQYSACTSILIGKKATIDGSIIIGRNEDAKTSWPKNYTIHPREDFTTNQVFKSNDNNFTMPLPKHRAKYSATPEWTTKFGLFEEDGFNEYGVGMSATESTYTNDLILGFDPLVEDGIGEEAMITVVLPYVETARQGVQRLGSIIEKYGTCESNGILFSDHEEAWYMETGGGHNWVAVKVPDDSYAVVSNQISIQEIDFSDNNNYMWSHNIRDFVNENHLNPSLDGTFNFRNIFGTDSLLDEHYNYPRVWYGIKMFSPSKEFTPTSKDMPFFNKPDKKLSIIDAQKFLSSHYQGTDFDPIGEGSEKDKHRFRPVSLAKTQESHILQTRPDLPIGLSEIQWIAMGVAAQSSYIPFYSGAIDAPDEYKNSTAQYQPDQAYWIYKLVGVLVDPHYLELGGKLSEAQTELNIKFQNNIKKTDMIAKDLSGSELTGYLTKVNLKNSKIGIQTFKKLTSDLITNSTDFSLLNYKQETNL